MVWCTAHHACPYRTTYHTFLRKLCPEQVLTRSTMEELRQPHTLFGRTLVRAEETGLTRGSCAVVQAWPRPTDLVLLTTPPGEGMSGYGARLNRTGPSSEPRHSSGITKQMASQCFSGRPFTVLSVTPTRNMRVHRYEQIWASNF